MLAQSYNTPMSPINVSDYKTLANFLRGYLHQDFRLEYKTPVAALQAYRRDATPTEVANLKNELDRFLREIQGMPFDAVQRLLTVQFGSGWLPRNREDLSQLCSVLHSSK